MGTRSVRSDPPLLLLLCCSGCEGLPEGVSPGSADAQQAQAFLGSLSFPLQPSFCSAPVGWVPGSGKTLIPVSTFQISPGSLYQGVPFSRGGKDSPGHTFSIPLSASMLRLPGFAFQVKGNISRWRTLSFPQSLPFRRLHDLV